MEPAGGLVVTPPALETVGCAEEDPATGEPVSAGVAVGQVIPVKQVSPTGQLTISEHAVSEEQVSLAPK